MDLGRQRHLHAGMPRMDQIAERDFVGRVGIGVQQADRDRLDPVGDQRIDGRRSLRLVQRRDDLARVGHAPDHAQTAVAGGEGLGELQEQVMNVVALLGPHLEDVAEPLGRQQAQPAAAPLDDGVGDQRRAVDDLVKIRERQALPPQQVGHARQRTLGRVARRGQALVQMDASAPFVQQNEICKRSPDIEAQTKSVCACHRRLHPHRHPSRTVRQPNSSLNTRTEVLTKRPSVAWSTASPRSLEAGRAGHPANHARPHQGPSGGGRCQGNTPIVAA